jgi:hypothetical protein
MGTQPNISREAKFHTWHHMYIKTKKMAKMVAMCTMMTTNMIANMVTATML